MFVEQFNTPASEGKADILRRTCFQQLVDKEWTSNAIPPWANPDLGAVFECGLDPTEFSLQFILRKRAMQETLLQVLSADLAIAYLRVILVGITHGITGFVAGLVNVALLTFVYGPVEAIALSALLGIVSSVMLLRKATNHIQWDETNPLGVAVAVTVPLAATLLLVTDSSIVNPSIGVLIVACGLSFIVGWRYSGPRNLFAAAAVGAVSGSVQGFTSARETLNGFPFSRNPQTGIGAKGLYSCHRFFNGSYIDFYTPNRRWNWTRDFCSRRGSHSRDIDWYVGRHSVI